MLEKSSRTIGVAPITRPYINRVHENMLRRGVITNQEPYIRIQRVIKSIVKIWAQTNLKISDQIWDSIQLEEISLTTAEDSEMVFIRCTSSEDSAKITSQARNPPQEHGPTAPRLIMHVDPRAKARYRAINAIAKTIRDKFDGQLQTSVRSGKSDFLLRQKVRGDPTPWSSIPPIIITQPLPSFEVGLYKGLFTPEELDTSQDNSHHQEESDMDTIQEEMQRQNLTNNKRDRSDDQTSFNLPKVNKQSELSESDPESDNENSHHKSNKYLNSTPLNHRIHSTENNQNAGHPASPKSLSQEPSNVILAHETPAGRKHSIPSTTPMETIPETPEFAIQNMCLKRTQV